MVYAQMFNNSISNIIELDDTNLIPTFTVGYETLIRIDNRSENPAIGWYYDKVTDVFYPPMTTTRIENFVEETIVETNPTIPSYYVKSTANITTSSATPSVLLTITPAAGIYIVQFSGSANTVGASAAGSFGIYLNGSLIADTARPISCNLQLLGGLVTISLNNIAVGSYTGSQVTLNGTDVIDIRFRSTNGGTIGFTERSMILMNIGDS